MGAYPTSFSPKSERLPMSPLTFVPPKVRVYPHTKLNYRLITANTAKHCIMVESKFLSRTKPAQKRPAAVVIIMTRAVAVIIPATSRGSIMHWVRRKIGGSGRRLIALFHILQGYVTTTLFLKVVLETDHSGTPIYHKLLAP